MDTDATPAAPSPIHIAWSAGRAFARTVLRMSTMLSTSASGNIDSGPVAA